MSFAITPAHADDFPALAGLLPRLASFPHPAHRTREEVYAYDARVLSQWHEGAVPEARVLVARDTELGRAIGFALITMKPDPLNGAFSAHLETLVVAEDWEGRGVGTALMRKTEELSVEEGAESLTLHVFDANRRARALYEREGYQPEWLRYIKLLT